MSELENYLRINRDRYTREALTRRAIEAGHAPPDVEAAWRRIDLDDTGGNPGRDLPARRPGLGTFLLIGGVALAYGYTTLLGVGSIGYMSYGNVPGRQPGTAAVVLSAAYVLAMAVGFIFSVWRLFRAPSLAQGASAIGAALAISIGILIGINGACIAGVVAGSAIGGL